MDQVRDLQDAFNAIESLVDDIKGDRDTFESEAEAAEIKVENLNDQLRDANDRIEELEQANLAKEI